MANGIWPWSGGSAGAIRHIKDKFGISGAVVSAVDVINGLGMALGMDVVKVPGATGYIDTNYRGKARAAIASLQTHDLVYLHVEAADEVSHAQDLDKKLMVIEDFDSLIVKPVIEHAGAELNVALLPDHPVPVATGKHTRTPVPLAVRITGRAPDAIQTFNEMSCPNGDLGHMKGRDLMDLLFSPEG